MNNNGIKYLVILFFLILQLDLFSQSNFEKAENYFSKRYENADGLIAPSKNINRAIRFYKKGKTPESISGLLRAYEFKGSYTKQAKIIRKRIFKRAIRIGKKSLEEYPSDIKIKYYYMANLGRWGQTISVVKAHEKGVLDEVKSITEDLIQSNNNFDEAGAKRILGAIHLKAPNIPFVLTWPSEDTALELLKSAYERAPENFGNARLYAEALIENGDDESAKQLLNEIIHSEPRKDHLLEDLKNIEEAKILYEEHFQ